MSPKKHPASRKTPGVEIVLLAVIGESPAVLTETAWALARSENPATVPARVIVVTTTAGAARVENELLAASPQFGGRSPWQALREELLGPRVEEPLLVLEPPRIITGGADRAGRARQLDDVRSPDDNAATADFILEQVRAITSNPDTRLIASIAGGRKTMGALLYAAMTLLGRETDRVTHVLVKSPFDLRLEPPFYFPARKATDHKLRVAGDRDRIHSSREAVIELADVPFVPLRNGFEELRAPVGGFAGLVARYSGALIELGEPPVVDFEETETAVLFDGRPVKLENAAQLAIVQWLFRLQDKLRGTRITFKEFADIVRAAEAGSHSLDGRNQHEAIAIAESVRATDGREAPAWTKDLDAPLVTRALSILRERVREVCPRWRPAPRKLVLPPFRLAR